MASTLAGTTLLLHFLIFSELMGNESTTGNRTGKLIPEGRWFHWPSAAFQPMRRAERWMYKFNTHGLRAGASERYALLREILGHAGKGLWVKPPIMFDFG